ncbi:MAG: glucose-6-phosphate isomerase [Candidatus Omnitrophica bacterium]|nr:glucose-6-phosphate isomerase [Candidatus Omnitrophota bacterium]
MPSEQTLLLGPHAVHVKSALHQLQTERFFSRLWKHDTSLWTTEATAQALISQRIGWLTIHRVMAKEADALRRFAEDVRDAGLTHVFLLGMGGSGLFSEVCRHTFGIAAGHPDLVVLDTTDPTAIREQQRRCPLERLLVIVSSKSGSTSETSALSKYFYEALKSADGHPGAHCLAITDAGTPLEAQAKAWRFRRVFAHGPGSGADVGGRFSALTAFGLVPAALMGVDAAALLRRADDMFSRCGPDAPILDNPAAQLGAVLGALAPRGFDKLTIVCTPALASVGTWIEQLIAESLGKGGCGIAPICAEPVREPAAYASDRVFVELQLASRLDGVMDRQIRALEQAGHPVVRIRWDDPYDLGGEVAKWCLATAVAGALLRVNPFDEPNVKESKDRTKALLEQRAREGRFLDEEEPLFSDAELAVYGTTAGWSASASLTQCLSEFFKRLHPSDYIALLSFLPRTPALDRLTTALRERLARETAHATMLGFGPRYLHSTGQLYKGGPDTGIFLLFTGDEPEDLAIPGEPFSFGVLKYAQALGDFQAMQERGRRILRIHLRGNLDQSMERLARTISEISGGLDI